MKRSKYIEPEVLVCEIETNQMIAESGPELSDKDASKDLDVLVNEKFTDIWGN